MSQRRVGWIDDAVLIPSSSGLLFEYYAADDDRQLHTVLIPSSSGLLFEFWMGLVVIRGIRLNPFFIRSAV